MSGSIRSEQQPATFYMVNEEMLEQITDRVIASVKKKMQVDDPTLSLSEAADYLHMSEAHLRQRLKKRIGFMKDIGDKSEITFLKSDLDKYRKSIYHPSEQ